MRFASTMLAAVLALAVVAGCANDSRQEAGNRQLAGELLGGGQYDTSSHLGRVTVVNFWGSWCAPCRAETPELIAAYEATRGDDVAFLGINIRDPNRDQATAFVDSFKVPYPSIYDPKSELALVFDVPPATIPATLVLDRQGNVAETFRRAVLRDDLIAAVRKVADRSPPGKATG